MIGVSSDSPHVSTSRRWLASQLGEQPNIVAEEPLDQVPAAVAHSGIAVTMATADRAALWEGEGLIARRLSPTPFIDYGVSHLKGNTSPSLQNILGIVGEFAPPLPSKLPDGGEPVWIPQEPARRVGYPPVG